MSKMAKKTVEKLLEVALIQEDELPYHVPENWTWTTADLICDVRDGTHDSPKYQSEGYPLITSKNLKSGKLDFNNVNYISEEDHINIGKRSKVDEQDILFAMIGTIGNPVLIDVKEEDFSIKNVALFKPNQKVVDSKYLYRYLDSPQYIEPLKKNAKGSTQKFVALGKLRKSFVPLPPLYEQKRIADKVERLINKIGEAKQIIDEAKETFELRRAAILDKAFRGELTSKWRGVNTEVESAITHISSAFDNTMSDYDEGCKLAKENKIPKPKKPEISKYFNPSQNEKGVKDLPNGWICTTFSHLCILQRGFDLPTSKRKEGAYPIVSAGGIIDTHDEYKVVGPGVTTGRSGTIGKVFYVEGKYWPLNTSLFVENFNGNMPKYVYYYLQTFNFKKFSSSTAVPTLNRNNLMNEPVLIPPVDEQREIVEILENLLEKESNAYELIVNLEQELNLKKQAILSKAFRGELGTNDPTEESSVELLKRVLEEQVN